MLWCSMLPASRKEGHSEIRHIKFGRVQDGGERRMGLVGQGPHRGGAKVTGKGIMALCILGGG